jgi:magnesium chelatase family protein
VKKSGSTLDLPIALALISAAAEATPTRLENLLVLGELTLSGELRAVRGMLCHLRAALARGMRAAIVPQGNAAEAALVAGMEVRVAYNLADVVQYLLCSADLARASASDDPHGEPCSLDLSDVRGQAAAKRALEVAAAGGHNLLMIGPPGTGKTMLAQRIASILPAPSDQEALEIATIASAVGMTPPARLSQVRRPFRAPHHSASHAALIGGGSPIRPGEVTLAHGGVLFLDELPEFSRMTLESLRPTMESGMAVVVRARERVAWPAQPLLVAAMNPCPCGYADDPTRVCTCPIDRVERYRGRISGPLLDRFDMHIALRPVDARTLREGERGETSRAVAARVACVRERRAGREPLGSPERLAQRCQSEALALLERAVDTLGLSVRAYVKALRVAHTIADLADSERVQGEHMAEAIQYRLLDRAQGKARALSGLTSAARAEPESAQ